eukprot:gene17342-19073_t
MSMFEKTVKASPSKADPKKTIRIPCLSAFSIGRIGSGSDYYAFYQTAGIPAIDIMYGMKDVHSKFGTTSYYPVYHSLYDTYYWMKTFIDPKFLVHRAVARFAASLLLKLSTPNIIPLDPRDYSTALSKGAEDIKRIFKMKNIMPHNVSTGESVKLSFTKASEKTTSLKSQTLHDNMAQFRSPHRKTIIITIAIVLGLILAFFVGYLVRRAVYKPVCRPKSSATNNPPSEWAITTGIKAEEIDANLK